MDSIETKGLLVAVILKTWERDPELPLGQLIATAAPANLALQSDEELLHRLCTRYGFDEKELAEEVGLEGSEDPENPEIDLES